ncbi:hypothetical protein [Bradyrhizobium paxllaeri]|uniref:hypothetical protein n=1 Tax=Bradyrhizobium paxllaeri TaxID=190148 RepID=UPI001651E5BD|nr:hypothetical protein [Bradyrhizobium paxllaeri]
MIKPELGPARIDDCLTMPFLTIIHKTVYRNRPVVGWIHDVIVSAEVQDEVRQAEEV